MALAFLLMWLGTNLILYAIHRELAALVSVMKDGHKEAHDGED